MSWDCTRCGACCFNARSNEEAGKVDYVPIYDRRSKLLTRADLLTKYVRMNTDNEPHLRLDPSGRCSALKGKLGHSVKCVVYPHRPAPCRRVQVGDPECIRAREERGLPV